MRVCVFVFFNKILTWPIAEFLVKLVEAVRKSEGC